MMHRPISFGEIMSKANRIRSKRAEIIKLDFGCGPNPTEGFTGVDQIKFNDKIQILDIGSEMWPWDNDSVDEAKASHLIEHLTSVQRVHFVNELHRVLKPGATFLMICPHWSSCRAYGDPTHVWPPISEFWFYYLDKTWRATNAPHSDIKFWPEGFNCDFDVSWGYNLRPDVQTRSQEFQMTAMQNYKDVCQDIVATFKKR